MRYNYFSRLHFISTSGAAAVVIARIHPRAFRICVEPFRKQMAMKVIRFTEIKQRIKINTTRDHGDDDDDAMGLQRQGSSYNAEL